MKIAEIRSIPLLGETPIGGWAHEIEPSDNVHTLIEVESDEGLVGVGSVEAGVTAIIMRALTWALALLGGAVYIGRTFSASPKDKAAEI